MSTKEMDKGGYALGMLVNIVLIFSGVLFALYLSTYSGQSLAEKIDFYSSVAGTVVIAVLFLAPVVPMMSWIAKSKPSGKQFAYRVVALVCFQLIVMAYSPLIMKTYEDSGETIKKSIITEVNGKA